MLARRVIFWPLNRTEPPLAGDSSLQLVAHLVGRTFLHRIGAAAHQNDERKDGSFRQAFHPRIVGRVGRIARSWRNVVEALKG